MHQADGGWPKWKSFSTHFVHRSQGPLENHTPRPILSFLRAGDNRKGVLISLLGCLSWGLIISLICKCVLGTDSWIVNDEDTIRGKVPPKSD